jgi:diguanylate cyclase
MSAAEAWLVGLSAFGLAGLFALVALAWLSNRQNARSKATGAEVAATALQLDRQATAILDLVHTYLDAGERYSVSLAQAGQKLPKLATPEELGIIVKFLLAENAKMQHEAGELKKCLEHSKLQIDDLRSHLAEAQETGMRDPLTSLGNRRRFEDRLAQEVDSARARGAALCVVMADIDNFKKVNDLFGHRTGDRLLKAFARVLVANVGADDTVARYGGEEFAIILPDTPVADAKQLTERMRSQLEGMQFAVDDAGQKLAAITASFGIAELGAGEDAGDLVHRADLQLYQAKGAGRNRVAADHAAAA